MSKLKEIAASIEQQSNPPVHLWQPDNVGVIDIRIDSLGFWFHEGAGIARESLLKLFASILRFESEEYFLVTPVEKLKIEVEDVPFMVHQVEHVEETWVAMTNLHEQIIIGNDHPVEMRLYQDQWVPYVCLRYNLWARVNRSIYYQWVSAAMELQADEDAPLILKSQDYEFEVART
ncbi:MAG: DUF1285 domain-containing protein [Acidiferrobacterales bacterium]|nr:DUF1285 domain-containing protein [Acidiferrobacterales bacterium]